MRRAARWLLLVVVLGGGFGCRSGYSDSGNSCIARMPPIAIEHVVVFWLKQPGDAEARQKIIETSHEFRSIPGVLRVEAGHMIPSPRANVDKTFDVAVVMLFKDQQSLEAYQVHPRHKAMLAEVGPLVERTVAYDFARWPERN